MKKSAAFFMQVTICMFMLDSCHLHSRGDTDFTVSEDHHSFSMHADFDARKTRSVDEYMNRMIGQRSRMSFVNSRIDGKLAFDDHTTFYIKKYPGLLEITLDKDANSSESYRRVRSMCEGIKRIITE